MQKKPAFTKITLIDSGDTLAISLNVQISCESTRMLKVSQNQNYFFKPLQVDLLLFVFWKKLKTPERHFKIN